MGLLDFLTGEFIEVIDWVESDKDTMIWKFPDRDCNIKYGANLTVRESQVALFVNEGQIADVYAPGMYELSTQNMPILTTLRSWKMGFNSPFKCDVYFLSTRTFTNLKWGTPTPIILRDPQFKQVRVKAFGTYFIKISDPVKFFREYAGTQKALRIEELEESMRDIVSPKFGEALAEANVSVLDMVGQYSELSEKIKPLLQDDFAALGLELVKFQVTSTSLPKEVEDFYDKMTNMNMVENMNQFSQFQQANAIEKAAETPNSGMGAGIGAGAGFGMAQMFMNQQQQQQQNVPKQQTKEEIMSVLKDLGQMMKDGILTEKEFNDKKKDLLSRL